MYGQWRTETGVSAIFCELDSVVVMCGLDFLIDSMM